MLYLAQFYEPPHNKKLMANRIIAIVEFSATLEYRIAKWMQKIQTACGSNSLLRLVIIMAKKYYGMTFQSLSHL